MLPAGILTNDDSINKKNHAIIIGKGPSINKKNHLNPVAIRRAAAGMLPGWRQTATENGTQPGAWPSGGRKRSPPRPAAATLRPAK